MIKQTLAWIMVPVSLIIAIAGAVNGYRVPPCQQEDGGPYPCVWDGSNRGNGHGDRVIIDRDD